VIVLDLALQGIHDLVGSTRVRVQSGYTALVSSQVQPDTLVAGLCELLFAEGVSLGATDFAAPGARSTGGGITVTAADGATFRIMRDLRVGSSQLLEFQRDTKSFAEVATAADEISQFLRARVALPTRQTFEKVFLLRAADLPSAASVPELDTAEPEAATEEPEPAQLTARLEEIEVALAGHQRVEDLEFELDGLQKQRFSLEDQLRATASDGNELEEARAGVRQWRYLDALPEGFGSRHVAYLELVRKRDGDLERWQKERDGIERSERSAAVEPLLGDWRLWAGLGVGAMAVAVAVVLGGVFRYVALLDIPAFGLAVAILVQNLSQRERRERTLVRLRISDDRRGKILARDKEEISAVEALLAEVGLGDGEVRGALARREAARERLRELEQAAAAAARDPERIGLQEKCNELAARASKIEGELAILGSVPVDTLALRSEAEHIRGRLEACATPASEPEPAPEATAPQPMGEGWMRAALDLLLTDAASAARPLSERASLLVRALSENRLAGVQLDGDGAVAIRVGASGELVPWDRMPPAAQDLVYLALRGGLFLAIDQRARAPFVCADIAAHVSGGVAVTRTLFTTLGHGGQVIHIVRHPDQAPGAKYVARVEIR
jgi:hypothetical protein